MVLPFAGSQVSCEQQAWPPTHPNPRGSAWFISHSHEALTGAPGRRAAAAWSLRDPGPGATALPSSSPSALTGEGGAATGRGRRGQVWSQHTSLFPPEPPAAQPGRGRRPPRSLGDPLGLWQELRSSQQPDLPSAQGHATAQSALLPMDPDDMATGVLRDPRPQVAAGSTSNLTWLPQESNTSCGAAGKGVRRACPRGLLCPPGARSRPGAGARTLRVAEQTLRGR